MRFSFGKYKDISVEFVNSGYLKWLLDQDWFEEKYPDDYEFVVEEHGRRDDEQSHFYGDKVYI